jgi:hypothetical protein
VAHASVVDLNSDLVRLGRSNFDIFDGKLLAGFPGHGSLAGDGLLLDSIGQHVWFQTDENRRVLMVGLMEG